jgi:hypothetical protein
MIKFYVTQRSLFLNDLKRPNRMQTPKNNNNNNNINNNRMLTIAAETQEPSSLKKKKTLHQRLNNAGQIIKTRTPKSHTLFITL